MYFSTHTKWDTFTYKNKSYVSGTKLIFNGKCFLNGKEITLNNNVVTWLYDQGGDTYFNDDNYTYTCKLWDFEKGIVQIINNTNTTTRVTQTTEFYWTDDMVVKTMWYIIIMLFGVFFYDRIIIWIFATYVWYTSVFKKE